MDEPDIRALLHQMGVNVQRVSYTGSKKRTRWMNLSCPFAPYTHAKGTDMNPSFGITINEDGRSHYKCLSCGVHGSLSGMVTRLGGYQKRDLSKIRRWAEQVELKAGIARPVRDWEDVDPDDEEADRSIPDPSLVDTYPYAMGIPYLRSRGIGYPTPLKLGLRWDRFQQRILFPVYDQFDRFRGFTGRSVMHPSKLSKKNPKVRDYYGLDKRELLLRLPGNRPARTILCEGLFDYARLVSFGYDGAAAILGTSLTDEKVEIIVGMGVPVYLFMDNDLAGWQAAFGITQPDGRLERENAWAWRLYKEVPVWIVPYHHSLDGSDPGNLSRAQTQKAIDKAWLFTGRAPFDEAGHRTFRRVV